MLAIIHQKKKFMTSEIIQKYNQLVSETTQLAHPRVLINVCSHGNEVLGLSVMKELQKIPVVHGSLTFHIANPESVAQNCRFIESDLNRSFPGSPSGTHEERIAAEMMRYIPCFDYVIDIHSTVSGMTDCLIVEDDSSEIQSILSVCNHARTVLHMNATKGMSLFTATRLPDRTILSIAFEYGDNGSETVQKTSEDISHILKHLGVFAGSVTLAHHAPEQFDCYAAYPKLETDIANPDIINYTLVHSGDVIGRAIDGTDILADTDFYPVLFGETNYKTIFGFKARKILTK